MATSGSTRLAPPAALLSAILMTACATPPAPVTVPASLVPVDERQIDRLSARGELVYECRVATAGAHGATWMYVGADLELLDTEGRRIGRHTAQPPVWEALDGSRVVGQVKARTPAPSAGAAPWLLVSTRSTGGVGRLSNVASVQRVNTVGGGPPTGGCDAGAIGQRQRVPLIAQYVLFGR
jgi:hypothetical protein